MKLIRSLSTLPELFRAMTQIAEEAAASSDLFSSYKDDLHRHDRDSILNDAQPGDVYLWIIKVCGTWLTLVQPGGYAEMYLGVTGVSERYFLLQAPGPYREGTITEYARKDIARALEQVPANPSRVPRRRMLMEQLDTIDPQLRHTVLANELGGISTRPGAIAFVRRSGATEWVIPSLGKHRTQGAPSKPATAWKLAITSEFGHASLEAIDDKAFNAAVRRVEKARRPRQDIGAEACAARN
jgi:hypothetical protein